MVVLDEEDAELRSPLQLPESRQRGRLAEAVMAILRPSVAPEEPEEPEELADVVGG